ncbi:hypothetical protein ACGFOU_25370 [Streptomyces sp. NPDC048595]|uniref:hypothetical protein n=1 Tax=Streptomyces sp. NPDC048595 TaxID=3365576 RepID=UPI0037165FE7
MTVVLASVGLVGAGTAYAGGTGGGTPGQAQATRVEAPQQQTVRQDIGRQQWGDHHHRRKSHSHRVDIRQHTSCRTHEANVDILGNVGILNGLLANAGGGEGSSGVQHTRVGTHVGCNNIIRK